MKTLFKKICIASDHAGSKLKEVIKNTLVNKNIRAAQCFNLKSTKLSRLHNDANIITLGSRLLTKKNALNCIGVFLNTKFEGGRHSSRIRKI